VKLMKKLVLSLLGAATLAASSNAMALDTTVPYAVRIQRGPAGVPVGQAMFEFDSDIPFALPTPPTLVPPLPFPNGACEYDMQWDNFLVPLGLSAECFLAEQKTHGSQSCINNSMMGVTSILVSDPTMPCSGFNWFQNIDVVSQITLGEPWSPYGAPKAVLEGIIQFNSPVVGHAIYGLQLVSL
jgi:hypothetical protein